MSVIIGIILLVLGFVGAFASGLLGIGGAIIMIPLLLYVPELLVPGSGFGMKAVAGMSMVQVLAASLSGALKHRKNKYVSKPLVLYMGGGIVGGSFLGGIFSKYLAGDVIQIIFACLALLAAILMFVPKKDDGDDIKVEDLKFNKFLSVIIASIIGFLAGIIGGGGAFMLIPLMIYVLKIPTKITVGSSLTIVLLSAIAGFLGKLSTAQIPFWPALFLVLGALPGAQVGGAYSKKISSKKLRMIITVIIVVAAIKMWFDFLG